MYKSGVENIATYGSELRDINERNLSRIVAANVNFWRRRCNIDLWRLIVRNDANRYETETQVYILGTTEANRL